MKKLVCLILPLIMIFFTSPISCGFLITALVLVVMVAAPAIRKTRETAFRED